MSDEPAKVVKESNGVIFKLIIALILLGLGAGGTYFLAKTRPGLIGLPKSQSESQAEINALVAQIGKLITLPGDEQPTVATVTNADQLKEQPFFKNAKNGDKILIYQKANKAIIYRPSENKIIDVGAVNVTGPTATPAEVPATPEASPKATPKPTPAESPAP